jgi:UDP-2,4-diacetamido-2,4,6-trideoxy-beta-L-altropyranose hydrolase
MSDLSIRPAGLDDLQTYFKWVNDIDVRKNSFNSEPISLNEHQAWFTAALNSKLMHLYVLEQDGHPVGQIRFKIEGNQASVGFSVEVSQRGKGLGNKLLRLGIARFNEDFGGTIPIIASVKADNQLSVKSFLSVGFKEITVSSAHVREFRLELRR